MDEMDFKDIYIESVLGDIKACVGNKINLDVDDDVQDISGNRIEMTDSKMRVILKDILFHSSIVGFNEGIDLDKINYNFMIFQDTDEENAKRKFKCCLVLYYAALYFGSISLLNKFFQKSFNFGNDPEELSLCFLDLELAKMFEEDEYFRIAFKSKKVVDSFYQSIKKVKGKERRKYLEKFSRIIKQRDDLLETALTRNRLDIFDEDTYLKASKEQLGGVICNTSGALSEETITRINNLIKNTDFCQGYFENTEVMYANFTDEELADIGCDLERYYVNVINSGADLSRIKKLYAMNNSITDCKVTYDTRFLKIFSDEEIAQMNYAMITGLYYDGALFRTDDELSENEIIRLRKKYEKWSSQLKQEKSKFKVKALIGLS